MVDKAVFNSRKKACSMVEKAAFVERWQARATAAFAPLAATIAGTVTTLFLFRFAFFCG